MPETGIRTGLRFAAVLLFLLATLLSACAGKEDPARAQFRALLKQPVRLSPEDVTKLIDEVGHAIEGKTVRVVRDGTPREMTPEDRDLVLGMLTNRAGVFEEGQRVEGGTTWRVLNAPGRSVNMEYVAARKLWIDLDTFQPRRFQFNDEATSTGDLDVGIIVE